MRSITVLLAALVVASLAGCDREGEEVGDASSATTASEPSSVPPPDVDEDGARPGDGDVATTDTHGDRPRPDTVEAAGRGRAKEISRLQVWVDEHPDDPDLVYKYIKLARLCEDSGDLPEAFGAYRSASKLDPANLEALLKLAQFSGWMGDWSAEKHHAERALDVDADSPFALYFLAQGLLRLEEYDEAKRVARRLTEVDPDRPGGWEMLAEAILHSKELYTSERLVKAENLLLEGLKRNPDSSRLRTELGRVRADRVRTLTDPEERKKLMEQAERDFQEAVKTAERGRRTKAAE